MEQDTNLLALDAKVEGILFWKGEPVKIKKLAQILNVEESLILAALDVLRQKLEGRGLVLIFKEDEVMVGTSPQMSEVIEKITKEELAKDLGKAGLETISIILYKGPVSRAEIDNVRGVQSSFILRNLLIRGLIEKINKPGDQRSFLYRPTFELLSYLGVSKIEEIPEYEKIRKEFEIVESSDESNDSNERKDQTSSLDGRVENVENTYNGHGTNRTETPATDIAEK